MMSHQYRLHVIPGSPRSTSSILNFDILNIDYELVLHDMSSLKQEAFLKVNPFGKAPALETPEGPLFESGAINRWAAKKADRLMGKTNYETAQIEQWYHWIRTTMSTSLNAFIYFVYGFVFGNQYTENEYRQTLNDFIKSLEPLENYLKGKKYLVKEELSIDDIVLVNDLNAVFKYCLDRKQREKIPNITQYFTNLINTPDFTKVLRGYKPSDKALRINFVTANICNEIKESAKNINKEEKKYKKDKRNKIDEKRKADKKHRKDKDSEDEIIDKKDKDSENEKKDKKNKMDKKDNDSEDEKKEKKQKKDKKDNDSEDEENKKKMNKNSKYEKNDKKRKKDKKENDSEDEKNDKKNKKDKKAKNDNDSEDEKKDKKHKKDKNSEDEDKDKKHKKDKHSEDEKKNKEEKECSGKKSDKKNKEIKKERQEGKGRC